MGGADIVEFTYGNLDRLTLAEYSIDDGNEAFTIDDLGNRDSVNVRDGNNVDYDIDNLTNRYDSVGGNTLAYDAAGNLTTDKDGYQYEYDYENRITKIIKSGPTTVAEFAYDALGRRIEKVDSVAGTTRIYYYNNNWQILSEYDGSNNYKKSYVYGNYIDEVLMSFVVPINSSCKYYVHDHLYSPAALLYYTGPTFERYEYDAYGNCYILEPNFAPDPDDKTDYGNPYYFTGRQLDFLDGGDFKIQYNRNRYYNQYMGRWFTHDLLGYVDGMNLYEYTSSEPTHHIDPHGLMGCRRRPRKIKEEECLKPLNVGTVIGHDTSETRNFFMPLVRHYTGNAARLETGEGLLEHLSKFTKAKDSDGKNTCACVRTWVHAQHGWVHESISGKAADGGFGGGATVEDWTGFYGRVPPRGQPGLPGDPANYGGRARGGRDLSDLKGAIDCQQIRFCKPCRIYIYGCEVSNIGTFAGRLSVITACTVYAGRGKVSTTHKDGTGGWYSDPWRAEGGWDTWSGGKPENKKPGPTYITPTVDWE